MAYNKKNWQDNVSDITAAELNRMEQGIYDNSLIVDAVTNKLNPTDTETYKTAELTEGQITDVIGVNDIIIKGQTSQDGEPTPSSPQDVNVVSGSNVINIQEGKINKNNIIHIYSQGNTTSFMSNSRATSTYFECKPNTTYKILRSEIIQRANFRATSSPALEGTYTNYVSGANVTEMSITSGNQDKYIVIYYHWEGDSEASSDEVLDTLSAYELPGKELPLDLPVENLFDEVWEQGSINNTTGENVQNSNARRSVNYIPVLPETTYVFSRTITGNTMPIREYGANKQFIGNKSPFDGRISSLSQTFTTSSDVYFIRLVDFVNNSNNKVMIEQGSKSNAYTPYGTEPIELCKIGDYQDYFYKSGSKWYLHKEIERLVLDGSESWAKSSNSNVNRYYIPGTFISLPLNTNTVDLISDYFKCITQSQSDALNLGLSKLNDTSIMINFALSDTNFDTLAKLKEWLSNTLVKVNYVLKTPINTEITDTTLISQLEAIYNAPLYEQTNITQENNDLPMVLNITACKDNINGIKAFIRK